MRTGRTPAKMSWENMIQRCRNKNSINFQFYGGRGIQVCDRWKQFKNFLADMGERPSGTTLDRINNNGNYCPENCRWATRKEQSRNRRDNTVLTHNGESAAASEWAERLGISRNTLIGRIQSGMSHTDAITIPVRPHNRMVEIDGKVMSISAWSKHLGVPRKTLYHKNMVDRIRGFISLKKERDAI